MLYRNFEGHFQSWFLPEYGFLNETLAIPKDFGTHPDLGFARAVDGSGDVVIA